MSDPRNHLPVNPRDYLVLLSLTAGERHGYGIVKEVEEQSSGVVRMDPSNLYRSLKRLIGQGLVEESEPRSGNGDSERRRYYAITPLGRDVAVAEANRLRELTQIAQARRLITGSQ
jgi:DNA-binding PadR family transcriptional regulator